MANIWWAYDENNSSFSALPASPLLLPAIGLFFLLAVFDRMAERDRGKQIIKPASELKVDRTLFSSNKQRYCEMLEILKVRPFTEDEESEMYRLEHPPWSDPGESWTY
jgi:hypothetical protein